MSDTESCRYCGDPAGRNVFGLCDSCKRKSTVIFSRRDDGTYQCSLCSLAGRQTHLDVHDRPEHLREQHKIESGNRIQTITEHERLANGIGHRQTTLGETA